MRLLNLSLALLLVSVPSAQVLATAFDSHSARSATSAGGVESSAVRQDVRELVGELTRDRDDSDPKLIQQLADIRTREAMEGLLEVYGAMGSIYMRREVLRTFSTFDGVGDAEQPALQKLLDVATTDRVRELREAAIETLGECRKLGKTFLAMIVESTAQDEIRENAMDRHVLMMAEEDITWYRELYERKAGAAEPEKKKKKKSKTQRKKEEAERGAQGERKLHHLQSIREKAFVAIIETLEESQVIEAAEEERNAVIRRSALQDLHRRKARKVESIATKVFEYIEDNPRNRALAAEILADLNGAKVASEFIDVGQKFATPDFLRLAMADILAEMRDSAVDKKVGRLVGKGKPYEKRFALRAARYIVDKSLDKKIRRSLADKEPSIQTLAAQIVGERKDKDAQDDLRKMIKKSKDELVISSGLVALAALQGSDSEWLKELTEYLKHPSAEVRNASLIEIGKLGRTADLPMFVEMLSHNDWATRLAALRALGALKSKASVGPIIARMPAETGRMLHEFAGVLWVLTGQPFRTRSTSWTTWWENEERGFKVISDSALAEREAEEESRRLKQVTSTPEFFGVRIISHRVIFIIDVSGSMAESTRGDLEGQQPDPRIDVAKRELQKAIKSLDGEALFNLITFSSDVSVWLEDGVIGCSEKSREDAYEYIERLGAFGGTNLYASLQAAFEDMDADTIIILSDGEPSVGEVIDPFLIREDVKKWNEHRNIKISTISVGGSLQIMEWLAEDSGGTHVKYQ